MMKNTKNSLSTLRTVVAVLGLINLISPSKAGELYGLDLKGDTDVLRLQLESQAGSLSGVGMSKDQTTLAIDLKDVKLELIQQLIKKSFPQGHPMVGKLQVQPLAQGGARLLVNLKGPVDVLDETVAAISLDRSRWELVLGRHARLQELTEIEINDQAGQLAVALRGGPQLKVAAMVADKPPVLALDFVDLTPQQLQLPLKAMQSQSSLVKKVELQRGPKSGSRLLVHLKQGVELVAEPQVQHMDGASSMVVAAIPKPVLGPDGIVGLKIDSLEWIDQQGQRSLVLNGSAGVEVKVSQLDNPARLVLDLPGISGKRAAELAAGFKPSGALVLGAHVGASTGSSSQIILDLARALTQTPVVVAQESAGRGQRIVVAISSAPVMHVASVVPDAQPLAAQAAAVADTKYVLEPQLPLRSIKSVVLEGRPALDRQSGLEGNALSTISMLEMLDLGLKADPKYLAAKAEYEANAEAIPQARAAYLPTASFDYQHSRMTQDVSSTATAREYPLRNRTLTITQPILKPSAYVKLEQSQVATEQAKLSLVATEQDLIVRVAGAYLNFMAAQDALELAQAEREATQKQYEQARARLNSGLGTAVQLHETEGRFALTQAREVEAANRLDDARNGMKEIVGSEVKSLKPFVADFEAVPPEPAQVEPWVNAALDQNLSLQVRNLGTEIAAYEVTRQQAGYAPTLNLVYTRGFVNQGDSFIGATPSAGYSSNNKEIGVRFNMPLFEGGMTSSLVREALARQEKAINERDMEYRKTERQARSALLSVVSSAKTLGALRKALQAQESALESKVEGMKSGLYTIVQVVDAYRQMYSAKRDFLQARYDYLLNRLKLKQAVGSLGRSDLEDLADLLK